MRNPFKSLATKVEDHTERRSYEIAGKLLDAIEEMLHENKVTITINVEPKLKADQPING